MRPLRIEVEGFGPFRERVEVDLTDIELFAIVGPTGSGKSTIIDALTFGLYGQVARYDDAKAVAPAIHTLANRALVRVDLDLDGETWTVVRDVRRKPDGGATTKEARLQRGDEVVASGTREVNPAVIELLGLDFEQFTRTIVLPQGQFAELLHDKPADRQRLLRQLLGLDVFSRIGTAARALARDQSTRADTLAGVIDQAETAGTTPQRQAELAKRADTLADLVGDLDGRLAALEGLDEVHRDAQTRQQLLRDQHGLVDGWSVPAEVVDLGQRLGQARARDTRARAGAEAAAATLSAARTARDAGPDADVVARLVADRHQADERRQTLATLRAQVADADHAAAEATAAVTAAQESADAAETRLASTSAGADAAAFTALLSVGEPCPVCRQTVHAVPDHDPAAELATAQTAARAARSALRAAQTARDEAVGALATLSARATEATSTVAELDARLADAPEPSELEAQGALASRLAAELAAAAAAHDTAAAEAASAAEALSTLEVEQQQLRGRFSRLRDGVVTLEPPVLGDDDLHADWAALVEWTGTTARRLAAELADAERAATAAAVARDQARAAIRTRCAEADVDVAGIEPSRLAAHVTGEASRARADQTHHAERLRELEAQRAQHAELVAEATVARTLGGMLKADRFEAWLLEGALDDLLIAATDRLHELSGGQFSFARRGSDLAVRDHRNADELRDVKSLSGGETFLASLALALALAGRVTELAHAGAPRLESMFLDEGFGTLDPESLDLVAAALEDLGATRMIGVVTHIRDLAERLPARIEVRKGPTTSTVHLSGVIS